MVKRGVLSFVALSLLFSPRPALAAKVLIAEAARVGHPHVMTTAPFAVKGGWTAQWSLDCTNRPGLHAGQMAFIVGHGQFNWFPYQQWIDLFVTRVVPAQSGTYRFSHGGYYRLWLRVPSKCTWSVRVVG